jgi:hypothetical protein
VKEEKGGSVQRGEWLLLLVMVVMVEEEKDQAGALTRSPDAWRNVPTQGWCPNQRSDRDTHSAWRLNGRAFSASRKAFRSNSNSRGA